MVCQVCGRSVQEGDRFCTGCGVSLTEQPPITDDAAAATSTDATADASAPAAAESDLRELDIESLGKVVAAAAREGEPSDSSGAVADAATTTASPGGQLDTDATADEPVTEAPAARADGPDGSDGSAGSAPSADPGAPTELVELTADDGWGDVDPVWAPTAPTRRTTSAASTRTADLPETEPITEVWSRSSGEGAAVTRTTAAMGGDDSHLGAGEIEMTAAMPTMAPPGEPVRAIRFSAVTLFGIIAGAITLAAFFTTIIAVQSDVRLQPIEDSPEGFRTGSWLIDDLADNLSLGGLVAVLAIVVGAIATIFRWRWGSGLAAGAGLSIAGLAMLAVGLAQRPIDAAEEFARIPNEQVFTLTITRDVGYWLLIVAGALGIVVFFAAINDATGDHRSGLNPWFAALGGLATVVAVGGPLIPENLADFTDNWYIGDGPGDPSAMLLVGRLVQLGMLLVAGLVGFLSVRRWGLGVAIGGALPSLWLAVSTLFDLTDDPAGPGWRNPGADDTHLHGVTIIGMSALLAMWVLAAVAAYDQGVRERA